MQVGGQIYESGRTLSVVHAIISLNHNNWTTIVERVRY